MKCHKCAGDIEGDSRFCRHCGAKAVRVLGAGVNSSALRTSSGSQTGAASGMKSPLETRSTAGQGATAGAATAPRDIYRDPASEESIWQGRPAWRASFGLWLLWLLLSIAGLWGTARYTDGDAAMARTVWIFIIGAALMILVRETLIIYGLAYQLTTQRLFIHRGILLRVTDQVELIRIDDVRIVQGIFDRILNTGRLDIFSSDESDEQLTLRSISAPVEVAEALRLHVRGSRAKGTVAVEQI
ncbi:MAG TPA: PH domain-containing protein [Phycisphaerae bacterium]|nr:PH domain-containing protein [Phycisphaerae bacterium]